MHSNTPAPGFRVGQVAWIEGRVPCIVREIDAERRVARVDYPTRWAGARLWKRIPVAVCMLEAEPVTEARR